MRSARLCLSLFEIHPHAKLTRQLHQHVSALWKPNNPKIDDTIRIQFCNLPLSSKVGLETTLTSPGEIFKFLLEFLSFEGASTITEECLRIWPKARGSFGTPEACFVSKFWVKRGWDSTDQGFVLLVLKGISRGF